MKIWIKILLAIVIILVLCLNIWVMTRAEEEAWILCQPDSYVNVRRNASKRSEIIGRFELGTKIYLDGTRKAGFYHCVSLCLEEDEGWISKGYVVFDEPKRPQNMFQTIVSNGRVAARKTVKGRRTKWMKNGMSIKVYAISSEWAITNKGFIQSKYLSENE